jgi:hypothetical protein
VDYYCFLALAIASQFSLHGFYYLMIYRVKNEALEQSLGLKRWHLSWVMLLQVSVGLMPGGGAFIILFGQYLGLRRS